MKDAIYQKSAKGSEAIATRSAALGPKLRSMLIMVDGKRGLDELGKLGQMLGDPFDLLTQLATQGFIEPIAGTAAEPVTPAAPAAPARPTVSLPQAQRFASRRLTDLMGPDAAVDLCLRIEASRNAQEFMAAVHKAEGLLRELAGPKVAATFAEEMQAYRPA